MRRSILLCLGAAAACGGGSGRGTASDDGIGDDGTGDDGDADGTATGIDEGPKFDVHSMNDAMADDGGPTDLCHVSDDMNAVGDCEMSAPADSFAPDVQWTFGATEQS